MSRTMLIWCPDWPVAAVGLVEDVPAHQPVAVLAANRVVACSAAARAEGIRRGLRRREAQARCPRLVVVEHDPARDARAFEPVVVAVEELTPGVELVRPGACAVAARGPARYFGSEAAAAERIVEHVAQTCGVEAQVGVADGAFAAGLAARSGRLVPPGETPDFLAGFDVDALDRPELVDLLRRLGVRTLGAFAALPAADVLGRFGADAALVHRLAAGRDERPLAARRPPPDLDVARTFDEPLDRVDAAAFAARQLAERLHAKLAGHGLACTRLGIVATTEHGGELHRTWRHDGLLTATAIADRVRWQLDGWLARAERHAGGHRPGPIIRLRLYPDGLVEHAGFQLGLWGDAGEKRDRAHRALTRVQGMLGPEAVVTGVLVGGRDPAGRIRLVPWGDERPTAAALGDELAPGGRAAAGAGTGPGQPAPWPGRLPAPWPGRLPAPWPGRLPAPWPGRLPAPSPASVPREPLPVDVLDRTGAPVGVSARLAVTAAPATLALVLSVSGRPVEVVQVAGWGGPWPVDERWWAPAEASRRVRFQVCLADGRALLLTLESATWWITGVYD
jgi:protein ImuB